jgi:hypothetical protein
MTSLPLMIAAKTRESVSLFIPRYFGNDRAHRMTSQKSTYIVIETTDRLSGKDDAVKVMSSPNLQNRNLITIVIRESSILCDFSHDNSVRFQYVVHANELACL